MAVDEVVNAIWNIPYWNAEKQSELLTGESLQCLYFLGFKVHIQVYKGYFSIVGFHDGYGSL